MIGLKVDVQPEKDSWNMDARHNIANCKTV